MTALRRHALAIGLIVDGLEEPDLERTHFRPGDIAEIRVGSDAGVLVRVTKVFDENVRGHKLAQTRPRNPMTIADAWLAHELVRVGHTDHPGSYPLHQVSPVPLEQQAERLRQEFVRRDEEKRAKRREQAARRKRRAEGQQDLPLVG